MIRPTTKGRRTLYFAVALLAASQAPVPAQDVPRVPVLTEELAEELRVGDLLRVRRADGPLMQGVLTRYEWPELRLADGAESSVVAIPDVTALWVRESGAKQGAWIGALAGLVLGAAAGVYVGEVICNDPDCRANTAGAALTFGLMGTGAGAGSGALIGLAVRRWDQRFP